MSTLSTKLDPHTIVEGWIESGETAAQIARELGINSGALSTYRKGSYAGNAANIDEAILKLHNTRQKMATRPLVSGAPKFFNTSITRTVQAFFIAALQTGGVHMVLGGSGLGKSTTCEKLVAENKNTWLIEITPGTASPRAVLLRICDVMGLVPNRRSQAELERVIIEKAKQHPVLLVIDESQHLPVKVLYEFCGLVNNCRVARRHNLGILLMGNEEVYSTVSKGYAQLQSRVRTDLRLEASLKEPDARLGAEAWAEHLGGLDKKMVDYLVKLGMQAGGFRNMEVVIEQGSIWSMGAKEPLSIKHLELAWNYSGRGRTNPVKATKN